MARRRGSYPAKGCRGRVLPSGDHFRLTVSAGPCPAYSVEPIDDYAAAEITSPDRVAHPSRQE